MTNRIIDLKNHLTNNLSDLFTVKEDSFGYNSLIVSSDHVKIRFFAVEGTSVFLAYIIGDKGYDSSWGKNMMVTKSDSVKFIRNSHRYFMYVNGDLSDEAYNGDHFVMTVNPHKYLIGT